MPVRDEASHLAGAVGSVLEQRYPGRIEVLVAVAPSADDTEAVAHALAGSDPRIVVVANPVGTTPAGLNAAIAASTGDVVARVDGHAVLGPGYLRTAVDVLSATNADNVGGIQRAVGTGTTQRAIAAAMTSRFGVGDARFHYGGDAGAVDTVYLGVFRRDALERVGGYDESLLRNQDYELNWRIRESGGVVWFDPRLVVDYTPRRTLVQLGSQYHQYGRWKRLVVRRDPRSVRWRQLVAPATALANVVAVTVGMSRWRPALVVPAIYALAAVMAAAIHRDVDTAARRRLPVVFAIMHHAWGLGFLRGIEEPTGR